MSHPHPNAPAQGAGNRHEPKNGLGTAGFVLGLIGLLFSFIPLIGIIAWPLVILGVIFSAIGLSRATKGAATNKGLSIAGLALSIIGLVVCIVMAAAFSKAVNDVNEEANRPATIVYEVTGDAPDVTISYSSFGDNVTMSTENAATLPWKKQQDVTGLIKGGSLTVTTSAAGGSVTCKVTIDGKEAKTAQASGPMAMASCSGF